MAFNEDTRTVQEIAKDNRKLRIMELISKGYSMRSVHLILEKEFDLTTAISRNKVIKEALLGLSEAFDIDSIKNINVERLEAIFERTQIGDLPDDKLALSVIDMINKTVGVYEANKTKEAPIAENMNVTISFD